MVCLWHIYHISISWPHQTPPKDCLRSPKEKPHRWRSSTMVTSLKRWKAEEELSAKSTGLKPWPNPLRGCRRNPEILFVDSWPNFLKVTSSGGGVRKLHWFDARCFHEKSWGLEGLKKGNWRVEKFCRCNKQLVLEVLSKNGTRKMNLVLDPWFYVMTSKHLKPVDWSWLMLQILNILLNTVASLSEVTHVI